MTYKTVTVTVDVEVDIDEFDTDELIEEMNLRGYTCIKSNGSVDFDNEDWHFLLDILDKIPETWYTRRIREKLLTARFS